MSITTVVIAVLALIVLVVLIVIFTGQTGKFTEGTKTAQGDKVCEDAAPYPKGMISLGGEWSFSCDPAKGQTELSQQPSYSPDLATHYGMKCCTKSNK